MKKVKIKIGYVALMMFILSAPSYGQEDASMFDMTLEELMNMQVTSASKKAEDLFDAPSVIATISSNEISDFGGRTLYEVLERAASFYGVSSYLFPNNAIALRGDLPAQINPNILFLINGRPVRESIKGGQQIGFFTTFPLQVIQKIEVIRGPGSVLYGSNAYVGVVNIITKKSTDEQLIIEANAGTFNSTKVEGAWAGSINDLNITAGFNLYKTDGWAFSDSLFFAGAARYGVDDYGQDALSGFVDLNYKKVTLSAYHGINTLGKVDHTGVAGDYDASRTFVDLGYLDSLTNWYTLGLNVTYNGLDDIIWVDAPNDYKYEQRSNDMIYEITNYLKISDDFDMTVGASISVNQGEQYYGDAHVLNGEPVPYPVEPYNTTWFNAYFQGDYSVTDWLQVVAGGQFNKVPSADLDFVPRLAVIGRAQNGFGTKLMYGEAFRAPFAPETDLLLRPVSGNKDVTPQKIRTFEGQVFYSHERGNLALTYFNSKQTDILTTVSNEDTSIPSISIYTNAGELDSHGLELEGKWVVDDNLFLTGSYSYQTNENDSGIENVELLPNHMVKIGASYTVKELVKLSVFNQYYSSPYKYSEVYETADRNRQGIGELGAYNWLTAKMNVNLNNAFGFDKPEIQLTAESVNLLDETVYNPEILFNGFDAIQTRPGRAFYFGLLVNL